MDEVTQAGEVASVHCSATQAAWTSSASAWTSSAAVDADANEQGAAVDMGGLYDGMHAAGLQYGPAFRTLEWCAVVTEGGKAVGVLRRRSRWEGTRTHPADLDGGLQFMSVLAPVGGARGGETRLPFAVDEARLRGAMVRALTKARAAA